MVIVRPMPLRKADGPLTVQVPSPGQDRPSWLGVGAVAVVGFVVGVAWPRLAGVRLGPSVPDSPAASASESEPAPVGTPSPPKVAPAVPAALPSPVASSPVVPSSQPSAAPAAAPGGLRVSVAHGAVFSCKTAGGESLKGAECGALPGLDGVVLPRLRKLADCPDAAAGSGKVHLVVRADFARNALAVEPGHDRGSPAAAPLLACAKSALASASLEGIAHDNPRYGVAYVVTLSAPAAAEPEAAAPPAPVADGTAQVVWDVAIVRDAPKTGKVLARLQRGTPLHIGTSKDGWVPVKYGDGFATEGWVYRGAIGR
jgi:Bacterial SH3 domain